MKRTQAFNNTFGARGFWRCAAAVLVLVLSMAGTPVAAQEGEVPRFEEAACETLGAPIPPEDAITCGYVVVPMFHQDPTGETVRLGVAILERRDPASDAPPLVIAHGGPGGSALEIYAQILAAHPLREQRDIVLFDQRGSRYTEPALMCPEIRDVTLATLDRDLPLEVELERSVEVSLACDQRLHAVEGIDLRAFNSLENAADVNALRVALGYRQIDLYGVSYGSLLTFHVLRDYAHGLRSIIVDGVVPPQVNFLTEIPVSIERAFDALFTACAADPACHKAYPNLEAVFFGAVARLNVEPHMIDLMDMETGKTYEAALDGDWLQSALFEMLYLTELIPALPRMIYDIAGGDYRMLADIQAMLVFDRTMSHGAYFSMLCAEDADYREEDIKTAGVDPRILRLEVRDVASVLDVCEGWHTVPLGDVVDAPVVSDVPALVLSGAFDPIAPPQFAEVAAETLSQSYVFTFPNGGHGALAGGTCQDQIILDFLEDPTRAPDSQCIGTLAPMFYTPENTLMFPAVRQILHADPQTWRGVIVFTLGVLVLSSAFLVYPVIWLFKVLRRQRRESRAKALARVETLLSLEEEKGAPVGTSEPPPAYGPLPWLEPALAMGLIALHAIFAGGLVIVMFRMIFANEMRIYFGVAASWWPLFTVPPLALVFTGLMTAVSLRAWHVRFGSVWRRLYYAGLTLTAWAVLVPLVLSDAMEVLW
jgi:pimeloyl-ACP methyl ester carboxylesterase